MKAVALTSFVEKKRSCRIHVINNLNHTFKQGITENIVVSLDAT
jgi:hypothetical protein